MKEIEFSLRLRVINTIIFIPKVLSSLKNVLLFISILKAIRGGLEMSLRVIKPRRGAFKITVFKKKYGLQTYRNAGVFRKISFRHSGKFFAL